MTTRLTDTQLQAIKEGCDGVTPGPWGVWAEPTPSKDDAIAELTRQVQQTEPFDGAVYLLNASGKCPATTGCGPTSAANAHHISRLDPETVRAMATELIERRAGDSAIVEACAKVAEGVWAEARDSEWGLGFNFARVLIAAAIRALAPPAPAVTLTQEQLAKFIYDAFPFEARFGLPHKPAWVEGGNSLMQDKARSAAGAILAAQRGGA